MKRDLLLTTLFATTLIVPTLRAQGQDDPGQSNQPKTAPSDASRAETPARLDNPSATADPSKTTEANRPAGEASVKGSQHHRASQVLGMEIVNLQDEKVGTVNEIAIDLSARRVSAVVISSGGFLGIADELSIVPPSALKLAPEGDAFTANLTKEQLTNAPRFQGTEYPDLNDPKYVLDLYKAYEAEPYLEGIDADGAANDHARRVVRASEILGMDVKNHQNETIGDIHEVILNASLDRVSSIVVSSGGFLGIGENLSVLPGEAVTITKDAIVLNATKETLERSPRFTTEAWPERMNDPAYLVDVYSPYQFNGETQSDVDLNVNAATGLKDSESDTVRKKEEPGGLTAQDQGSSTGDIAITTNIRRRLVSHDSLSFSAKNIRVITVDGTVTLAGQVASKEELDSVVNIAEEESAAEKVKNQLTVKD